MGNVIKISCWSMLAKMLRMFQNRLIILSRICMTICSFLFNGKEETGETIWTVLCVPHWEFRDTLCTGFFPCSDARRRLLNSLLGILLLAMHLYLKELPKNIQITETSGIVYPLQFSILLNIMYSILI